jgi:carbonic anhydrase
MSTIDELVIANRTFASSAPGQLPQEARPSRRVAVLACMDARIDVLSALGLQPGDAHVLRNAGGVVTDDVLRSLIVSQRRLDTREVMLIQHTRCGMQQLDEQELRAELHQAAGAAPEWTFASFADLDASVRQSIARVRECEFLAHRDGVRGFVYDVDTRLLREVSA